LLHVQTDKIIKPRGAAAGLRRMSSKTRALHR
jgi:hypothetical protein